ncbi:hypothetical protein [Plasticicumulans acidivorans]|uniref:Uncharacterized protein n=1 Tax=Plasticicumulans acidivorans TaxID=886464 RepID=A0A317MPW7_9GAMM|nr:hypothetical protein [Plasticicumulans acidivorans]PWV57745.1 hypothetical protein C7443_1225 [Plasticicumulans acidivorans]
MSLLDSELFSRRVTLRVVEGLRAALQQPMSRIAFGTSFAVFEQVVGQGVSVNLCESVAKLAQEVGRGWVSWEQARPAAQANFPY